MSATLYVQCEDCLLCKAVGQGPYHGPGEGHLWQAAPHAAKLSEFVMAHEGHRLRLVREPQDDWWYDTYRDVDDDDAEQPPGRQVPPREDMGPKPAS